MLKPDQISWIEARERQAEIRWRNNYHGSRVKYERYIMERNMESYIPLKVTQSDDLTSNYSAQIIQQIPQGLKDKLEVMITGDLHRLRLSIWVRPIGRNDLAREHVVWTFNNGEPPRRITIPDDFIAFFSALS